MTRRVVARTGLGLLVLSMQTPGRAQQSVTLAPELLQRAQAEGTVRIIVQLDVAVQPEGQLGAQQALIQRQAIAVTQGQVLGRLAAANTRLVRQFETVPFVALEVAPDALAVLAQSPGVVGIEEDRLVAPTLAQSVPLIDGDDAWAAGFDGSGWAVAILDTGVDKAHSFLSGKVVQEACFSGNGNCPNSSTTQIGSGAGVPCTYAPSACRHGTHVGGIAAGRGSSFSGVAKGANLIAIQVFSRFTGANCGTGENPCALAFTSDIVAGLERVHALRSSLQIASANMSLGGGSFTTQASCDSANASTKAAIDNLRSAGIATVISSGNNGFTDRISSPGCISSAISVGSTTKSNTISSFSNSASFLSLLAPGSSINSSVPGGGFAFFSGTSMAAPHVAGAWAILKQRTPMATVTGVLNALRTSSTITDPRNGVATPRIEILKAINFFGTEISVNDVTVTEGNSGTKNATFSVSLSEASASTVTVQYATTDGTGVAGGDYVATSGTLTFSAGSTSQTVSVPINGDMDVELREMFTLNLSNASGGTITDGVGIGRIKNDDFTDPSLSGVVIKEVHITELRTLINDLLASDFSFTDSPLIPQLTSMKAIHIMELRTALDAVYAAAGQTPPSYTEAPLIGGFIKAIHITETRDAVVNAP